MTLPTSTTNMTGFFATMRGSSFRNESPIARLTIAGSKSDLGAFFGFTEPDDSGTKGAGGSFIISLQ
jgi:hypothetical protein